MVKGGYGATLMVQHCGYQNDAKQIDPICDDFLLMDLFVIKYEGNETYLLNYYVERWVWESEIPGSIFTGVIILLLEFLVTTL